MYTVGVTGASGMPYAYRLLRYFAEQNVPVELVVSDPGWSVLEQELPRFAKDIQDRAAWVSQHFGTNCRLWSNQDWSSPIASGSGKSKGMVIIPCSMGTLGRIAAGVSSTLLERAADVCLKERRPLILVTREMPLNLIHLENMVRLMRAGAVLMPASPGFYHNPNSLEQVIDFVVSRVLDQLGIENNLGRAWGDRE